MVEYTTIKIRKDMAQQIDLFILNRKHLFYKNRSDFLHDALREKIHRLNDQEGQ